MLGELLAPDTPLTAITAAMGQLGAATAVVQAIALGELLRRDAIPPIVGLVEPVAGALSPSATARSSGHIDGAGSLAVASSSYGGTTHAALALSTGAPGLAAAIRIEVCR
jgi:hypothetical protein